MEMILATLLLPALPVTVLLVVMWRTSSAWRWNRILQRALFAFLAALLAPTLLMAGHGGLPCPTIGGVVLVLMRLEWIGDLQANFIAFGGKDAAILSAPFLFVFAAAVFVPLPGSRPLWSAQE